MRGERERVCVSKHTHTYLRRSGSTVKCSRSQIQLLFNIKCSLVYLIAYFFEFYFTSYHTYLHISYTHSYAIFFYIKSGIKNFVVEIKPLNLLGTSSIIYTFMESQLGDFPNVYTQKRKKAFMYSG